MSNNNDATITVTFKVKAHHRKYVRNQDLTKAINREMRVAELKSECGLELIDVNVKDAS